MLVICNNFFDDRCLFFTFVAYKKSGQNVVAPRVPTFWRHRWRLWSIIEKAQGNIRD